MYHLTVFYRDEALPRERVELERATEVLTTVPELLERHPECARVVVMADSVRLFAVDCRGNRLPD